MVETPKLDELARHITKYTSKPFLSFDLSASSKETLIVEALLEIREILKTVRQKSLP